MTSCSLVGCVASVSDRRDMIGGCSVTRNAATEKLSRVQLKSENYFRMIENGSEMLRQIWYKHSWRGGECGRGLALVGCQLLPVV